MRSRSRGFASDSNPHEDVYRALADALGARLEGDDEGDGPRSQVRSATPSDEVPAANAADLVALGRSAQDGRCGLVDAIATAQHIVGGHAVRIHLSNIPRAPHDSSPAFAFYRALLVYLAAKAPTGSTINAHVCGTDVIIYTPETLADCVDQASRSRRFKALAACAGLSITGGAGHLTLSGL